MNKLFLISITLLLSCKKDKILNIERNFLCEIVDTYSHTGNTRTEKYDFVLSTKIEGDFIVFDGFEFPLSAYEMETGSGSHKIYNSSGTIELTFSNEFNDIYLYQHTLSTSNSPGITKAISGTCIELTSITSANLLDSQSGIYDLTVQAFETANGLDTAYTDALSVLYNSFNEVLNIDGELYGLQPFHSHYNYVGHHSVSGGNEFSVKDLSWSNNSLHFDYFKVYGNTWNSDTTHYIYEGIKQ